MSRLLRRFAATGLLLLSTSVGASAQWIYNAQGGDFDDNPTHLALTSSGGYGLGVRCKAGVVEFVLITPDQSFSEGDALELVNMAEPKLKYRVDGGEIHEVAGLLTKTDQGVGFYGKVERDDVDRLISAKKGISTVISILGDNYHETKFSPRGSSAALGKLVDACLR